MSSKPPPIWHLYLIRTQIGHLYTGIAIDVDKRLAAHKKGSGAKFLRGKGALKLVFRQPIGTQAEASRAERAVKKFSKAKKEKLARGEVALWDLMSGEGWK